MPRCSFDPALLLPLVAACTLLSLALPVRAEDVGTPIWQLALGGGLGHAASTLPSGRGPAGVRSSAFPAVGVEVGLRLPLMAAWNIATEFGYASSVGYTVERPLVTDTRESADARKQELGLRGALEWRPGQLPFAIGAGLGYAARAFSTDTALLSPASYLLTGPYALAGLRVWLFEQRLELRLLAELGAVQTASEALKRAGADRVGLSYAASAALRIQLTEHWHLALSYRLARATRSLRDGGEFHDDQGFLFASVAWRSGT
jgi:opacity protein-like surface antigen